MFNRIKKADAVFAAQAIVRVCVILCAVVAKYGGQDNLDYCFGQC